ncbi:hypothetical protein IV55_GL001630 [Furfurilactobacillus siliginis]|nr:hypothetical protein IV55_GL001630 [Furfurilactobacillus siliginis]
MMIATTVVVSRLLIIPVPLTHGNINLSDAGILVAALLLGPWLGGSVGALTGFLLDLLSGYGQYMMFSLIIHGLEGVIAGQVKNTKNKWTRFYVLLLSICVMVIGYFIVDKLFYGFYASLVGIGGNFIQGIVGMVIALISTPQIKGKLRSDL